MQNEVSFKKWNGARKEESGNETEWNEDWMRTIKAMNELSRKANVVCIN